MRVQQLVQPQQNTAQYFDGLVQDCCNSSVLAMELLQSCTKPSTCVDLKHAICCAYMNTAILAMKYLS